MITLLSNLLPTFQKFPLTSQPLVSLNYVLATSCSSPNQFNLIFLTLQSRSCSKILTLPLHLYQEQANCLGWHSHPPKYSKNLYLRMLNPDSPIPNASSTTYLHLLREKYSNKKVAEGLGETKHQKRAQ